MELTPELVFGLIGMVTGITSLIVSIYFNRTAIKQTDRNLKTQLIYEDKKRALLSLQKIVDETRILKDLREKIGSFLNSFEGNFIPREVIDEVYVSLRKLEKFEDEKSPYPTQNQLYGEVYDDYDPTEGLNEFEKFDYYFENEFDSFKSSVKHSINKVLKKI